MSKDLLVLRHGKAKDLEIIDRQGDFVRDLRQRGKRDAQRVGVWLAKKDLVPDCVISSPAVRAKRTASKTCKASGLDSSVITFDERVYDAGLNDLYEVIRDVPETAERLLLVGHNPSLEMLVEAVCEGPVPRTEKGVIMPTAALIHVRLECAWARIGHNRGAFVEATRPKLLPKDFPFPGPDGPEQRPRPAYYYRQSSVVPYRRRDGGLEVLLISSGKQKRWGLPKGIHDPGKSAQESAAHEAFEEAGVEGEVAHDPIGTYSYDKWEGTCTVSVYPMHVTRIIPEDEWEESHRGRQWLSIAEAARLVSSGDVKAMIEKLPDVIAASSVSEG